MRCSLIDVNTETNLDIQVITRQSEPSKLNLVERAVIWPTLYMCGCSFTSRESVQFIKHILTSPDHPIPYQCMHCTETIALVDSIIEHYHTHSQTTILPHSFYQCSFCSFHSRHSTSFLDHVSKSHQDAQLFTCPYCDITAPTAELLVKHMEIYKDLNKVQFLYKCGDCKQQMKTKRSLKRHIMRDHHGSYLCGFCSEKFKTLNDMSTHLDANIYDIYKCEECSFLHTSIEKMEQHVINLHCMAECTVVKKSLPGKCLNKVGLNKLVQSNTDIPKAPRKEQTTSRQTSKKSTTKNGQGIKRPYALSVTCNICGDHFDFERVNEHVDICKRRKIDTPMKECDASLALEENSNSQNVHKIHQQDKQGTKTKESSVPIIPGPSDKNASIDDESDDIAVVFSTDKSTASSTAVDTNPVNIKTEMPLQDTNAGRFVCFECAGCTFETKDMVIMLSHLSECNHAREAALRLTADGCRPPLNASPTRQICYTCPHCPYDAYSSNDMCVHMQQHAKQMSVYTNSQFSCPYCSMIFQWYYELYDHMLEHKGRTTLTLFTCQLCKYRTTLDALAKDHALEVHEQRLNPARFVSMFECQDSSCSICGRLLKSNTSCTVCQSRLYTQQAQHQHQNQQVMTPQVQAQNQICRITNVKSEFPDGQPLDSYIGNTSHSINSAGQYADDPRSINQSGNMNSDNIKCPLCTMTFRNHYELQSHNQQAHDTKSLISNNSNNNAEETMASVFAQHISNKEPSPEHSRHSPVVHQEKEKRVDSVNVPGSRRSIGSNVPSSEDGTIDSVIDNSWEEGSESTVDRVEMLRPRSKRKPRSKVKRKRSSNDSLSESSFEEDLEATINWEELTTSRVLRPRTKRKASNSDNLSESNFDEDSESTEDGEDVHPSKELRSRAKRNQSNKTPTNLKTSKEGNAHIQRVFSKTATSSLDRESIAEVNDKDENGTKKCTPKKLSLLNAKCTPKKVDETGVQIQASSINSSPNQSIVTTSKVTSTINKECKTSAVALTDISKTSAAPGDSACHDQVKESSSRKISNESNENNVEFETSAIRVLPLTKTGDFMIPKEKVFPTYIQCSDCSYKSRIQSSLVYHIQQVHIQKRTQNIKLPVSKYLSDCSQRRDSHKLGVAENLPSVGKDSYKYQHSFETKVNVTPSDLLPGHETRGTSLHCSSCSFIGKTLEQLEIHIYLKHTLKKHFFCKYCGFKAESDKTIRSHCMDFHKSLPVGHKILPADMDPNPWLCLSLVNDVLNSSKRKHVYADDKDRNQNTIITKHEDETVSGASEKFSVLPRRNTCNVKRSRINRVFKCNVCNFQPGRNSMYEVGRHINKNHLGVNSYSCTKCNAQFYKKDECKQHCMAEHKSHTYVHFNKPPTFKVVRKVGDISYLGTEIEEDPKEEKTEAYSREIIFCGLCNKSDKDEDVVKKHILNKHVRFLPFRCMLCNQSLYNQESAEAHCKDSHKGKERDKCIAAAVAPNIDHTIKEVKGKTYIGDISLAKPMEKFTEQLPISEAVSQNSSSLTTGKECKDTATTNIGIHPLPTLPLEQSDNVTIVNSVTSSPEKQTEKITRQFKCGICHQVKTNKHNMKKHVLAVHMKTCMYHCKLCPIGYFSISLIVKHVKSKHNKTSVDGYIRTQKLPELLETNNSDYTIFSPSVDTDTSSHEKPFTSPMKSTITKDMIHEDYTNEQEVKTQKIVCSVNDPSVDLKKTSGIPTECLGSTKDKEHFTPTANQTGGNKEKITRCGECGKTNLSFDNMRRHVREVHMKLGRYYCSLCDTFKNCSRKESIKKHLKSVHKKCSERYIGVQKMPSLKRVISRKYVTFSPGVNWKLHSPISNTQVKTSRNEELNCKSNVKNAKPGQQMYKCDKCKKTSYMSHIILRHILTVHLGLHRYTCTVCGIGKEYAPSLLSHIHSIHKIKNPEKMMRKHEMPPVVKKRSGEYIVYTTEQCKKQISIRPKYKSIRPKYKCDECKKTFDLQTSIHRHVKTVHLGMNRYNCSVCGIGKENLSILSQHVKLKHQGKNLEATVITNKMPQFVQERRGKYVVYTTKLKQDSPSSDISSQTIKRGSEVQSVHRNSAYWKKKYGKTSRLSLFKKAYLKHKQDKTIAKYQCAECKKMFDSVSYTLHHVRCVHLGYKRYSCTVCKRGFDRTSKTLQHIWNKHKSNNPEEAMIKNVMPKLVYKKRGSITVYTTQLKETLDESSNQLSPTINDSSEYQCEKCGKKFMSRTNAYRHVHTVHLGISRYSCTLCRKGFESTSLALQHMRLTHAGKNPEGVITKNEIPQLLWKQMGSLYVCSAELKETPSESSHKMSSNNNNSTKRDLSNISHSENPELSAEIRNKIPKVILKRTSYHDLEVKQDCGDSNQMSPTIGTSSGKPKYQCEQCQKKFSSRHSVLRHVLTVHLGLNRFGCTLCGKAFESLPLALRHILLTHESKNPEEEITKNTMPQLVWKKRGSVFVCSTELKKTPSESSNKPSPTSNSSINKDLNDSPRLSDPEKPGVSQDQTDKSSKHLAVNIACAVCMNTFPSRMKTYKHICKIHLDIAIHQCSVCDQLFKTHENSIVHIQKEHGGEATSQVEIPIELKKAELKGNTILIGNVEWARKEMEKIKCFADDVLNENSSAECYDQDVSEGLFDKDFEKLLDGIDIDKAIASVDESKDTQKSDGISAILDKTVIAASEENPVSYSLSCEVSPISPAVHSEEAPISQGASSEGAQSTPGVLTEVAPISYAPSSKVIPEAQVIHSDDVLNKDISAECYDQDVSEELSDKDFEKLLDGIDFDEAIASVDERKDTPKNDGISAILDTTVIAANEEKTVSYSPSSEVAATAPEVHSEEAPISQGASSEDTQNTPGVLTKVAPISYVPPSKVTPETQVIHSEVVPIFHEPSREEVIMAPELPNDEVTIGKVPPIVHEPSTEVTTFAHEHEQFSKVTPNAEMSPISLEPASEVIPVTSEVLSEHEEFSKVTPNAEMSPISLEPASEVIPVTSEVLSEHEQFGKVTPNAEMSPISHEPASEVIPVTSEVLSEHEQFSKVTPNAEMSPVSHEPASEVIPVTSEVLSEVAHIPPQSQVASLTSGSHTEVLSSVQLYPENRRLSSLEKEDGGNLFDEPECFQESENSTSGSVTHPCDALFQQQSSQDDICDPLTQKASASDVGNIDETLDMLNKLAPSELEDLLNMSASNNPSNEYERTLDESSNLTNISEAISKQIDIDKDAVVTQGSESSHLKANNSSVKNTKEQNDIPDNGAIPKNVEDNDSDSSCSNKREAQETLRLSEDKKETDKLKLSCDNNTSSIPNKNETRVEPSKADAIGLNIAESDQEIYQALSAPSVLPVEDKSNETNTSGYYKCGKCKGESPLKFVSKASLISHMCGNHFMYTPFVCQICLYRAGSKIGLQAHYKQMHPLTRCKFKYQRNETVEESVMKEIGKSTLFI